MAETPASERDPQAGAWLRHGDRTVCRSVEELAALWPGAAFISSSVEFYANALRLRFGRFRVETAVNSGYSCVRDRAMIAEHPRAGVAIEVVLEGRLHRHHEDLQYLQQPGEAAVTVLDEPFSYTWADSGRSVRTVAEIGMLPGPLRRPGAIRSGLLQPTALVASYIGFLRGLVDVAEPGTVAQRALEQSAIVLHEAVLLEAAAPPSEEGDSLHSRIDRYIDQHLSSRQLSPASIAAEFGVSLRSVHNAFRGTGTSLAAEIRRRRVTAAVEMLRRGDANLTVAVIAREVGFSGPDQLGRSLRAITGQPSTVHRN